MEYKFSKYPNVKSTDKVDINLQDYITIIKTGMNQDLVLKARIFKQQGDKKSYDNLKSTSGAIIGSAIMNDGKKEASNISYLNGLIVIDIDCEIDNTMLSNLKQDRYSFITHRSFGGDGVCIFVKINPDKFLESFNGLADYYFKKFAIVIDKSCSNPNRLRYISFDPDLHLNEKSAKFITKNPNQYKEIKEQNYVFTNSDFDNVLDQIKSRSIDLCKDDYFRYLRIGFAIFNKFGASGLQHFDFICSFGSKYNYKDVEKHYKNFSKDGQTTIATFYHYCKEEGVEIYSQNTKDIINSVKVQKSQGNPTIESVKKHLLVVNPNAEIDNELIEFLIESKKDYSKGFLENESNISQLEKFILEAYQPKTNLLTNETYLNTGERLDDKKLNNIYIASVKFFDFAVSKNDIRDIINSDCVPHFNPIRKYFQENKSENTNAIDNYVNCIEPNNEYNNWAFKKWIVGAVHNWLSDIYEPKVCPLTLVLCGQKQGTGKTSFFRELLPIELRDYLAETKIDLNNKDSVFNLTKNLIVLDDEFGGLATRDVKDFKKMADTNIIDMRLPYGSIYSKFKRRASLSGTSNENNILKDVTGNRRILPLRVEKIDYNKMISIDKDSLWKEAHELYKGGFDWKIYTDKDVDYLSINTMSNVDVIPIEEIFFNHFSLTKNDIFTERRIVNQGEVLNYLSINTGIRPSKFDIKDVFVKNKMDYKPYKWAGTTKKGVEVWEKPNYNATQNSQEVPF